MIRVLSACLLLFALSPAVRAQCATYSSARYATYSTPTYYEAPIVKKKVVEEIVFQRYIAVLPLLDLPTYGAYYVAPPPTAAAPAVAPAPAAAPTAQPCGDMARVLKLLESMDDRIRRLEGGGASAPGREPVSPPPRAPGKVDLRQINQQKCSACHQQGNEAKGGDFVLSDASGSIVKLTDGQLADLQTHVVKGSMPKMNATSRAVGITPLTDDEAEAWIEEARRQRAVNRAATKK